MSIARNTFSNPESHTLILAKIATSLFGLDWLEWEPITVYEEIKMHGFDPVSQVNAGKLNAFRVAKLTYSPWLDWEVFESVGRAFNNSIPSFEIVQPLSVGEISVTLDILNSIKTCPFADEVNGYIASCAKLDELDYLPEPMSMAQSKLCRDLYKCLDCGNIDTDDLADGQCDVCCGRFDHELMGGNPNPLYADRGTNIVKFKEFDYSPLAKKYKVLRNSNRDDLQLGETAEDIQLAKLLSFDSYRKSFQMAYNIQHDTLTN